MASHGFTLKRPWLRSVAPRARAPLRRKKCILLPRATETLSIAIHSQRLGEFLEDVGKAFTCIAICRQVDAAHPLLEARTVHDLHGEVISTPSLLTPSTSKHVSPLRRHVVKCRYARGG